MNGRWNAVGHLRRAAVLVRRPAAGNPEPTGAALIVELAPDEFLVTGFHARVTIHPADEDVDMIYDRVEEGTYENGRWKFLRVWNGDQTDYGLNFSSAMQLLRVKLATYAERAAPWRRAMTCMRIPRSCTDARISAA